MALLVNTAEGGTDGATVTTGNSGGASGDAWAAVDGSPEYTDTDPIKGSMSITCPNDGSQERVSWTWSSTTQAVARFYVRYSSTGANQGRLFEFIGGARIYILSGGRPSLRNAAGSSVFDSSDAFSTGTIYRIEISNLAATSTTGACVLSIFEGDDTTPIAGMSTTVTDANFGTALTGIRVGRLINANSGVHDLDDIAAETDTLTLLGPSGGASTDITGTPTVVTAVAGTATVTATTEVTASATVVTAVAGTAQVTATTELSGTPTTVAAVVGSATVTATTEITGAPTTVQPAAGTAQITATTEISATPTTVTAVAGTAQVSATVSVTGTPTTVTAVSGTATVTATTELTGTPTVVQPAAGTGQVSAAVTITGTATSTTVVAGTADITATAQITGTPTRVQPVAGAATLTATADLTGVGTVVIAIAAVANIIAGDITPVITGRLTITDLTAARTLTSTDEDRTITDLTPDRTLTETR